MSFSGNQYPNYADKVITTRGDVIRGSSTGARERLGLGSANQVLQSDGTDIDWETLALADSTLTTQGDILYQNASGLARLGQSTDGHVLTTKGASANPVWAAAAGGGATANFLGADHTATAHTTFVFAALGFGNNNKYDATEASVDIPVHMAFTLVRGTYNVQFNSANATAVLTFRDDGANKANVTTTVGVTGAYDTGAISESVASGSLCNWGLDASSVSSGELGVTPYMVLYD
jgi:hypothetical protein